MMLCSRAEAGCHRSMARLKFPSATVIVTRSIRLTKAALSRGACDFSGMSPDGILPEIIEYEDHPWFIGVQFHPELKSRPFEPHPLFSSFIGAAVERSRLV